MAIRPAAAALTRALLMLERSGATGELEVDCASGRARIALANGRIESIDAPMLRCPRLGEFVPALLALPSERVDSARSDSRARIGEVAAGLGMSAGEILRGLRRQWRVRMRELLSAPSVDLRFEAHDKPVHPFVSMRPSELLLASLRSLFDPADGCRVEVKGRELTTVGRALTHGVPLWPEEAALSWALSNRAPIPCDAPRARALLAILDAVEGLSTPPANGSMALLVQKTRAVRRGQIGVELLDVPPNADSATIRKAYRRLAGNLHPDRFACAARPIAQLSHELSVALNAIRA